MSRRGEKTEKTGVYRLEDGRLRVLAAATNPETGEVEQRQRTLSKKKTVDDAVEVRKRLMAKIREPTTPTTAPTTLADYCEQWMKGKAKTMKPSSARTAAKVIGDHILPVQVTLHGKSVDLGEVPLDELTRNHVKGWRKYACNATKQNGDPYSTATVRKWWRYLKPIIKDLEADRYIPRDYSRRIDPPATSESEVNKKPLFNWYQLQAIRNAAKEVAPARHAEIAVLVRTGMRSGELWALKWRDLDYRARTIHVRRSVSDGEVTPGTKTDDDRKPPMFDPLPEVLKSWRKYMLREKPPGFDTNLVFPSQAGTPRTPRSLEKAFANIAGALKLEVQPTPQLIRQSVATSMRNHDIPEPRITAILGNTPETRDEYYWQPDAATRSRLDPLKGGISREFLDQSFGSDEQAESEDIADLTDAQ